MKITGLYSHLNGHEWLQIHKPGLWKEIEDTIHSIDAEKYKTKVSKEQGMLGKKLYAPKQLNKKFGSILESKEWKERRANYWVTDDYQLIRKTMFLQSKDQKKCIESEGKEPIKSYNQTDFLKERVAIEVQFGKYSFIAYDLFVKHMAFYVGDIIDVGIEILPMKSMQKEMSSGPGYYEGALYDIVRQGRGVPAVPLILLGVEP